jgi:RNA polymerase sigma factor (sigma-70 family)
VSIPEEWTQTEREAYWAWEKGDETGLIKACEPLIRSLAKSIAEDARRGRSDELSQPSRHRRFEQGRHKEASLAEDGLREAMEVVDFDDLYHAGCQAVLDVKERYDPDRKKSFQTFAYKRIRGAMRDLLAEKQKREAEQASLDSSEVAPRDPTAQLVALAEQGELDDSFIEQVALFLSGHETLDDWRDYIESASFEVVRFFWWFLYQFADELDPEVGWAKRVRMLGVATTRYWLLRFEDAAAKGAKLINISGPQHLEITERGRKAAKAYPAKLDDKPAGRLLSEDKKKPIDGKTIARWRNDMREAGVPPLIKEDGSFTLKSQEDYDAWNEYFLKIAHPRVWRRLRRRRQRDSQ